MSLESLYLLINSILNVAFLIFMIKTGSLWIVGLLIISLTLYFMLAKTSDIYTLAFGYTEDNNDKILDAEPYILLIGRKKIGVDTVCRDPDGNTRYAMRNEYIETGTITITFTTYTNKYTIPNNCNIAIIKSNLIMDDKSKEQVEIAKQQLCNIGSDLVDIKYDTDYGWDKTIKIKEIIDLNYPSLFILCFLTQTLWLLSCVCCDKEIVQVDRHVTTDLLMEV